MTRWIKAKRPTHVVGNAVTVAKIATGEATEQVAVVAEKGKSGAAQKLGGRGGKARAKALSPERRKEIAKKAALARWIKAKPKPNDFGIAHELPSDDRRQTKYAKQRAERGFDDTETWNLDITIAAFITPRLKRFKEINDGHPPDLTDEKQWDAELDEMIWAFEKLLNKHELGGVPIEAEIDRMTKAFELFARRIYYLWW